MGRGAILIQSRIIFSRQVHDENIGCAEVFLTLPRQNSDAVFALIHHRDITGLREVRYTAAENVGCLILNTARGCHGRHVYPTVR